MRAGKYTSYEGGIRVTSFVSGGFLPAERRGANCSALVHISDWYSVFSFLAGVPAADDAPGIPGIDAVNVWPAIIGTAPTVRADIHVAEGVLVAPRWKLSVNNPDGGHTLGWSGPLFPKVKAEPGVANRCNESMPCLWDLSADPAERADPFAVAKANPAVVQTMASRLRKLDAVTFSPKPVNVTGLPKLCDQAAAAGNWLVPLDYSLDQLHQRHRQRRLDRSHRHRQHHRAQHRHRLHHHPTNAAARMTPDLHTNGKCSTPSLTCGPAAAFAVPTRAA